MSIKFAVASLALLSAFPLTSCATLVDAELHHPGGVGGYYADRGFPAPSKRLQIYRATVAFALIARTGAQTLTETDEVLSFQRYLELIDRDIRRLDAHLAGGNCTSDNTGYCEQLFESDLPELEMHLLKAASLSLPTSQARGVWSSLSDGAYLSAVSAILKAAATGAAAAHADAALYRSQLEILAQAFDAPDTLMRTPRTASRYIAMVSPAARSARFERNGQAALATMYKTVQDSCKILQRRAGTDDALRCRFSYRPLDEDYRYRLDPTS